MLVSTIVPTIGHAAPVNIALNIEMYYYTVLLYCIYYYTVRVSNVGHFMVIK